MDMDLKRTLVDKLNEVAPEYGLVELSYPSFMRSYGYRTQPLSAADAVEGIHALLDVAEGVRMEIEIEGTRNGGEWFGRGKIWEGDRHAMDKKRDERPLRGPDNESQGLDDDLSQEEQWWIRNFWTAYDAVSKYVEFTPTGFGPRIKFY
jgi:cell division control protein 45